MRISTFMVLGIIVATAAREVALSQTDDAVSRLVASRSLRCQFDQGTQAKWETGNLKIETVRFGEGGAVTFDSINSKAGRARVIGNAGAGDVDLIPAAGALTFVETTGLGSVNVTTVFGEYRTRLSREFIAVQSRHIIGMLGSAPLPSQFHGTCRVLE